MTASYDGASRLVDTLAALGVKDIFMLCGNHVLPVVEALRSRDIRVVAARSEAAAVFAADGYGRVTRSPSVALVTGGPGMSNTITAMLTAQGNRSPVIVISGEADQAGDGRGAQQETAHTTLSAPATKWRRGLRRTSQIEQSIVEAYRVAQTGTPGAVHLAVPLDVLREPVERTIPAVDAAFVASGSAPSEFVAEAATLLQAARRPAIVAGAGVWQCEGDDALRVLCERLPIPVFTLDSARGAVSDDAAHCFGSADVGLNAAARHLTDADVVLVAGRPIDFRLGLGSTFSPHATVIHVDSDIETLGRNLRHVRACLGNPARFIGDLDKAMRHVEMDTGWNARLRSARLDEQSATASVVASGAGVPAHPAAIADVLGRVGNTFAATFAVDCGEFAQWCRQVIPARRPGAWLRLGPQATCGAGLPFGIGAKVAAPRRPTLVIAGDGGLGYHIAELETAVRENVPLVVVVGHDNGWGIERNLQQGIYGPGADYGTSLSATSWTSIAEGFGAAGISVDEPAALGDAVSDALSNGRTTLIQIPVRTVASIVTKLMVERERGGDRGLNV